MSYPILEALPSVHSTLIGIGGGFFSAFAIYAYQKLHEATDHLDRVLRDVESFSMPNTYIGSGSEAALLEGGELKWDHVAKDVVFRAKSLFSHLDYEQQFGITDARFVRDITDEEVLAVCRDLCSVLYYVFVSYPLSGRSLVHVQGITDTLEERKRERFGEPRLREIERRLHFLTWCWETSQLSLLELARRATEAEQEHRLREQKARFEESMARMQITSEEERSRIWSQFHQPHININIDYRDVIAGYFNKVATFVQQVLPALRESVRLHDLYNSRFQIKSLSIAVLFLSMLLLLVGVLLPLVLLAVARDLGLRWLPSTEYAVLVLTSAPYFISATWLFLRLRRSSFV